MIHRVRLRQYMSFGPEQTAELQPITVVVGANNSGKTNFLRFVDFIRGRGLGFTSYFHRPSSHPNMLVQWDADVTDGASPIVATYRVNVVKTSDDPRLKVHESIVENNEQIYTHNGRLGEDVGINYRGDSIAIARVGIYADDFARQYPHLKRINEVEALVRPVFEARHVHLHVERLRAENTLVPEASIGADGNNLAALVADWILRSPEKAEKFNSFLRQCLPEMRRVHAKCFHSGQVRLEFEQRDGERFDASQVSDGVLIFSGLIAHALEAPHGGLMLLEEPERGIHPRRLAELVDLLRTLVHESGVQFILATHSPALVNQFRAEPEAILAFTRSSEGTKIHRISDMPDLAETLSRTDPGELLANGFFNEAVPPKADNP